MRSGGVRNNLLRISFSNATLDRLAAQDPITEAMVYFSPSGDRYFGLRIVLSMVTNPLIPAFHVTLEAPGPDMRGWPLRTHRGRRRFVLVIAPRLGIDFSRVHATIPEIYWPETLPGLGSGLLAVYPDELRMLPGEPDRDVRRFFARYAVRLPERKKKPPVRGGTEGL